MSGSGRRLAGVLGLVGTVLATGCAGTTTTTSAALPAGAGAIADPMATSVVTSEGDWATVAMGTLSDPLNTFWQLFDRPLGSHAWKDDVEATATATNGGLVATSSGSDVIVGVVPSQELHFSPLIHSINGGRTWSTGILPGGLVAKPDAMATEGGGEILAVIGHAGSEEVVQSGPGLTSWSNLTSLASLESSPGGSTCDIGSIDAVGYAGSMPVVGTSCGKPGQVGLFFDASGTLSPGGPALPASLKADTVSVLGLRSTGFGVAALFGFAGPGGEGLVAGWTTGAGGVWQLSSQTPLDTAASLESLGPSGSTGFFALLSQQSGTQALEVIDGPEAPVWSTLPAPPPGTDTALMAGTAPEVFTGQKTVLTTWHLAETRWVEDQTLDVDIPFGSSG